MISEFWQLTRHYLVCRAQQRCEICGTVLDVTTATIHHRQPRSMGGTSNPDVHRLDNLMLLCGGRLGGVVGCHGLQVENDRAVAEAHGWLVPHGKGPASDPELVPVDVFAGRDHRWMPVYRRVLLDPHNPSYLPAAA